MQATKTMQVHMDIVYYRQLYYHHFYCRSTPVSWAKEAMVSLYTWIMVYINLQCSSETYSISDSAYNIPGVSYVSNPLHMLLPLTGTIESIIKPIAGQDLDLEQLVGAVILPESLLQLILTENVTEEVSTIFTLYRQSNLFPVTRQPARAEGLETSMHFRTIPLMMIQ